MRVLPLPDRLLVQCRGLTYSAPTRNRKQSGVCPSTRCTFMTIFAVFLLALALSMDAFAVSICKGLSLRNVKWHHMIIVGLWFGGFQALMPSIGYVLGSFFIELIDAYDHWVTFILLSAIGLNYD